MSMCLSAALLNAFCRHATVECAFINTGDLFTSFPFFPASLPHPLVFSNHPPSDQVPTDWGPLTNWVHWARSNLSSTRLKRRVGTNDRGVKVSAAVTECSLIMLKERGRKSNESKEADLIPVTALIHTQDSRCVEWCTASCKHTAWTWFHMG